MLHVATACESRPIPVTREVEIQETICSSSVWHLKRLFSRIKGIAAISMVMLSEKDRFEFPHIRVSTKVSLEFLSSFLSSHHFYRTKFGIKARRVETLANVILGTTKLGQTMKKWQRPLGQRKAQPADKFY